MIPNWNRLKTNTTIERGVLHRSDLKSYTYLASLHTQTLYYCMGAMVIPQNGPLNGRNLLSMTLIFDVWCWSVCLLLSFVFFVFHVPPSLSIDQCTFMSIPIPLRRCKHHHHHGHSLLRSYKLVKVSFTVQESTFTQAAVEWQRRRSQTLAIQQSPVYLRLRKQRQRICPTQQPRPTQGRCPTQRQRQRIWATNF